MNYQEQLQTVEWRNKRIEILKRDNYSCTKCKSKRSKFLRLSKNFGIKIYDYLTNNSCNSFEINEIKKYVYYSNYETCFENDANYISENEKIKYCIRT
jgi:hypothetical protein